MVNVCTNPMSPSGGTAGFQHTEAVQTGQTAQPTRRCPERRAGFAMSPVTSCEDLVLSTLKIPSCPQHFQHHQAFPPVRVFLCITSILQHIAQKGPTYHFAFWQCCRLNITVPLKVFDPSFKTASVNAHTAVIHQEYCGF